MVNKGTLTAKKLFSWFFFFASPKWRFFTKLGGVKSIIFLCPFPPAQKTLITFHCFWSKIFTNVVLTESFSLITFIVFPKILFFYVYLKRVSPWYFTFHLLAFPLNWWHATRPLFNMVARYTKLPKWPVRGSNSLMTIFYPLRDLIFLSCRMPQKENHPHVQKRDEWGAKNVTTAEGMIVESVGSAKTSGGLEVHQG